METRLAHLENVVLELQSSIRALDQRLAGVESRALPASAHGQPAGASPIAAIAAGPAVSDAQTDLVSVLSLTGRSLIILGGAYLLRAITEAGALPPLSGALLALAYATAWVAAAGRAASRGRPVDAAFHGFTGSIIGYPLIFEATVGFKFFTPGVSAAALGIFTGMTLLVAWRLRQRTLAWIATVASLGAAVALVLSTGVPMPYAVFLIALGVGTLWLGYLCDWTLLRWPVAAVADLIVLGLVLRALAVPPRDPPGVVVAVLLLLLSAYLASTAARTLLRGRNVIPFEVCQAALALLVGLGGSVWILRASPAGHVWFGSAVLGLGAAAYAVAFAFVDRRQGRGRNFYFYTSLAVVFTLVGGGLLLGVRNLPWFAVMLGLANAWLGVRYGRLVLSLHAVVYLLVAAAASGTLIEAGIAVTGLAGGLPGWPTAIALVTTAAALFAVVLPAARPAGIVAAWGRVPRMSMLALSLWLAGGCVIAALARLLIAQGSPATDGGVATIRTVVLSSSALLLGVVGRNTRVREAAWFVYPLLLLTGLKILIADLRSSAPSLLVVALATYGIALIVAPRLLRRRT